MATGPAPQTKPCPFCAEAIRAEATKCKHCGSLLGEAPVVIERTGKRYKRNMLSSALAAFLGLLGMVLAGSAHIPSLGFLSGLLFLGGLVAFVVARISAWWHHG
jgi:predicted nucleic acid-binding Zn ribbon protein